MGPEHKQHTEAHSNPLGAPKSTPDTPPARSLPLCSKCYCFVSKGVSHLCSKVQKQENLADFLKATSNRTKGKVTSTILKSLCSETGVTTQGGTVSLCTGGTPLPVQGGKSRKLTKVPRFTLESLKRLQAQNNFSDRTTKYVLLNCNLTHIYDGT